MCLNESALLEKDKVSKMKGGQKICLPLNFILFYTTFYNFFASLHHT